MKTMKNKAVLSVLALFFLLMVSGCNKGGSKETNGLSVANRPCIITPQLKSALQNYEIGGVGKDYIIVGQKNENGSLRYGCMDFDGRIILPVRYSGLSCAKGDLLIAEDFDKNKTHKRGCIDLKGKLKIPYKYDVIRYEGDFFIVRLGNKFGLLDRKGEVVVPLDYDGVAPFYTDYNSIIGTPYHYEGAFYLETNGDLKVVNPDRDRNPKLGKHHDTPYDYQRLERNGKCGFVNYLGEEIPCIYQDARKYFSEEYAAVVMNDKVGFIDTQGNVTIPFQFDYSKSRFQNNKPIYSRRWKSTSMSEYDDAYYYGAFSEGYASMMKNGKYGYIDKKGNTVIPFEYTWASPFHHGAAVVEKKYGGKEKYGLIDKNNSFILPIEYDGIQYFYYAEVFEVMQNGKCGLYSPQGKCLAPCQYDAFPGFFFNYYGYSTAYKDGKQGLIDASGQEVVPCVYDICSVLAEPEGLVSVKLNEKWGIVDVNNNVIVPLEFDSCGSTFYIDGLFYVNKDGRSGLYDKCGNCTLD